jgi:predicted nucleotide-binding protein (sugar kinase/HSP70/actin superfamily)
VYERPLWRADFRTKEKDQRLTEPDDPLSAIRAARARCGHGNLHSCHGRPENIKAGFLKERDIFVENGVVYASPFVSLGDRHLVTEQLHVGLKDVFDLELGETARAVTAGYAA